MLKLPKRSCATSLSALAIAMTATGMAQAQSTTSQPAVAPSDVANPTPQAGKDPGELQDIVVTAQKRAQNVQDVPIAITAVLGTQLQKSGIINVESLKMAFAGVNIRTTSSQFQPSIRGIGTQNSNVENAVGLYVDGVYYANQSDSRRELNDIDQVAVLKGPQGTLFGRNATAGVIQISTRRPSHTWSAELTSSLDNYATSRSGAYVTGGITETLAFSLSGNLALQGNGWGKNFTTGNDTYKIHHIVALRGKLLLQPDSVTDITLIGDYTDRADNLGAYFRPFPGTTVNPLVPHIETKSVYDSYANVDALNLYKGGGASMTIDRNLGGIKFQSITAYRRFRTGYRVDSDSNAVSAAALDTTHNQGRTFSQEAQLTSASEGKFNWAAGIFYFHYSNAQQPFVRNLAGPLFAPLPTSYAQRVIRSREVTNSVAPYAQFDYEFLPRTRITVGARWTYEKRTYDAVQSGTRVDGTFVPNITPAIDGASITAKKPTWRLALDHKFTEDTLGYVSYNRGFKSGGFNLTNPANPPYQPERLDAYEAGIKTRIFDRKLRLNIAGFYYKYQNLQVLQVVNQTTNITNGARAELYGVDMDFETQLSANLRLTGGLEVLHSEFTNYNGAQISFPVATGGVGVTTGDVSGNRLPFAQNFQGNIALDYSRDYSFGNLDLNAAANYNGNFFFEADNRNRQKHYTLVNLSLNWTPLNSRLVLGLYVRNLLDKKVVSYSTTSSPLQYQTTYDNPPRIYGASVRYKF